MTIPELGTIKAAHPPLVVLTTNATRDMTDALRRRCLHAFLDYPPPSRELAILELRVPGIAKDLGEALVRFVHDVRGLELRKAPSIAETIDWARALILLGASALDKELVSSTLGALVKHEEDRRKVEASLPKLLKSSSASKHVGVSSARSAVRRRRITPSRSHHGEAREARGGAPLD